MSLLRRFRPSMETRTRSTIRARLIWGFSITILVSAVIAAIVGVRLMQQQINDQAQAQVASDMESAKVIYRHRLDRLRDAMRIHATRMVIYGALAREDDSALGGEMELIRRAESLDMLTLTDLSGRVFFRSHNPGLRGDRPAREALVAGVLRTLAPASGTEILPKEELERESSVLAARARMAIVATPRARPSPDSEISSGMALVAAAPVQTPAGQPLGVLCGAVLLNRNYEIVDSVRETVFKGQSYEGREVGTSTIFQGDVRISTNVRGEDKQRAIATRASAEVADEVLDRGSPWRGRAFVVTDWYLAAYDPIADSSGHTIGMLYVGTLERPFTDSLARGLYLIVGIALLGVALVSGVAIQVAHRISRPIHAMAEAAQRIAEGDYSVTVPVESDDEVGYLASSFNRMTGEIERARRELSEWAETLERKVEQRSTELKAIQAQMFQSEKLAAVGKLAAGVAHEINNPLTGVLTNSSLMLKDLPEDDPRKEDLQVIVSETLRCRKIVKGLLDFARQTKPQKQYLDLNQVVEDVLALVRNQASFRNIAIRLALQPTLPPLLADSDQMRQVVLNIVLNAAEAMGGSGVLSVSSSPADRDRGVEVRISDTGPGIPEEARSRLFEPFYTTKRTGTGLGLAIVYGIVESHKGSLRFETETGKGTTFIIRLPAEGGSGDD